VLDVVAAVLGEMTRRRAISLLDSRRARMTLLRLAGGAEEVFDGR
jgi:hypothetical protein